MKSIHPISSLVLVVTLAVSAHAARPAHLDHPESADPAKVDPLVPFPAIRRFKVGMNPREVVTSMRGEPDVRANPNVWVYWDFKGNKRPADMENCALVLVFDGNRLAEAKLCDQRLVRATLAPYRATAPKVVVAR